MSEFYSVKVADIKKETADTVSIVLDIPNELKSSFDYKSGQYVTISVNLDNEELRRSYSLSSCSMADDEYRIAVKKIENGRVSTYLNDKLSVADELTISKPEGNFHYQQKSEPQSSVLFAAGSGITPIISILKAALADNESSRVTLFYGNRNENSIIYKNELNELKAKYGERLNVVYIFSQPLEQYDDIFKGRIEGKKVLALLRQYVDLSIDNSYYMCGPASMMQSIETTLDSCRVAKENIHLEYFIAPDAGSSDAGSTSDFSGTAIATFIINDEEIEATIEEGATILDTALQNDVDAPYSCRGAVCSSCIALIEEGSAEMKMNHVLSEEEVEQGFVLTCQACPTSSKLVVNYDEA